MSDHAKPTGVPKNQIPNKPIPQSGTPAASINASGKSLTYSKQSAVHA